MPSRKAQPSGTGAGAGTKRAWDESEAAAAAVVDGDDDDDHDNENEGEGEDQDDFEPLDEFEGVDEDAAREMEDEAAGVARDETDEAEEAERRAELRRAWGEVERGRERWATAAQLALEAEQATGGGEGDDDNDDEEQRARQEEVRQAWAAREAETQAWAAAAQRTLEQQERGDGEEAAVTVEAQRGTWASTARQAVLPRETKGDDFDDANGNADDDDGFGPAIQDGPTQTDHINHFMLAAVASAGIPEQCLLAGRGELPHQRAQRMEDGESDVDDEDSAGADADENADDRDAADEPVDPKLVAVFAGADVPEPVDDRPRLPYTSVPLAQRLEADRARLQDDAKTLAKLRQQAIERQDLLAARDAFELDAQARRVQRRADDARAVRLEREAELKAAREQAVRDFAASEEHARVLVADEAAKVEARIQAMDKARRERDAEAADARAKAVAAFRAAGGGGGGGKN